MTKLPPIDVLSHRETQVLNLVAQGLSNKEVGDRLFLSEWTVKDHMQKILWALNAKNRAHAVFVAMNRGLLEPPP